MCGIVGLFLKAERLEPELGRLTASMLHEMRDRGPDSAGFAVYGEAGAAHKVTVMAADGEARDWDALAARAAEALDADGRGAAVTARRVADHAILETEGDPATLRHWLLDNAPGLTVLATGRRIELYKGVGDPDRVAERFGLAARSGSHAIAHTRMATESAVTIAGSHPFSTGADTCLVHNGSLSNHNWLRLDLERDGERFQTENDSEVAAAYVAAHMRHGRDLKTALEAAIADLDGFYTFAVGTADGFAVLRDPIACKPAVIAETDDWVAMSSEFRAIAQLPGVGHAEIWEPEPGIVYSWSRNRGAPAS